MKIVYKGDMGFKGREKENKNCKLYVDFMLDIRANRSVDIWLVFMCAGVCWKINLKIVLFWVQKRARMRHNS